MNDTPSISNETMQLLIQAIENGFEKLHLDNDQTEAILQAQSRVEAHKNRKWL